MSFKKLLKELKRHKNFNFVDFATPIADLLCPIKYSPNGSYDNKYFITCLKNFVESGSTIWTKYRGTIEYPIKGKYLNEIHNKYLRYDVYSEIHRQLVNKYLKTDRESKLQAVSVDSSFIQNKQGSITKNDFLLSTKEKHKNELITEINNYLPKNQQKHIIHFIGFNRYNGGKNISKLL